MEKTVNFCIHAFWLLLSNVLFTFTLNAQNVNFSQYHLAPMLNNPAMMAASDEINLSLLYRRETAGNAASFITPILTGSYPLISTTTGKRWGGIGLLLLNDDAGEGGALKTTGASLAMAYNIDITPSIHMSLGVQGGYFQKRIDEQKLTTGSQWTGRAFDPGLETGENFSTTSIGFPSMEAGVLLYMEDSLHRQKAFLSGALRQMNQPDVSFTEVGSILPYSLILSGGARILQTENFSVFPNFRWIFQESIDQINVGSSFRYHFNKGYDAKGGYQESMIGFNAWYNVNHAIIAGVELKHSQYRISFSYDFNLTNPDRLGANAATEFMIGYFSSLAWKRNIQAIDTTTYIPDDQLAVELEYLDPKEMGFSDQDYDVLQRVVLFPFGETEISPSTEIFIDQLADVLMRNEEIMIEIGGHTDDEGNDEAQIIISGERARTIYNYLVDEKNISSDRLFIKGYGDKYTVATEVNEAGKIKNRRAEFKVVKPYVEEIYLDDEEEILNKDFDEEEEGEE